MEWFDSTHVGHVRSKPDCLFWDSAMWFFTFFHVFVEAHMTVHDVYVTQRMNSAIMQHWTYKFTNHAENRSQSMRDISIQCRGCRADVASHMRAFYATSAYVV